jgi:N-acetylmuramoyl-L-alanine amidase
MEKVIILDAGHGGFDKVKNIYVTAPSKQSPIWSDGSRYFEGVGNRDIINIASQYLRNLGWTVLYTTDPLDFYDKPLEERQDASDLHYKLFPDAFQISVHSNAYKKNIGRGAEVLISPKASKTSKVIARIWKEEHLKMFPNLKWRGIKVKNLAMNRVNCPSVLIETMFHSFEEECRILMSNEGKEKCAIAIVETAERIYKYRNQ